MASSYGRITPPSDRTRTAESKRATRDRQAERALSRAMREQSTRTAQAQAEQWATVTR